MLSNIYSTFTLLLLQDIFTHLSHFPLNIFHNYDYMLIYYFVEKSICFLMQSSEKKISTNRCLKMTAQKQCDQKKLFIV